MGLSKRLAMRADDRGAVSLVFGEHVTEADLLDGYRPWKKLASEIVSADVHRGESTVEVASDVWDSLVTLAERSLGRCERVASNSDDQPAGSLC